VQHQLVSIVHIIIHACFLFVFFNFSPLSFIFFFLSLLITSRPYILQCTKSNGDGAEKKKLSELVEKLDRLWYSISFHHPSVYNLTWSLDFEDTKLMHDNWLFKHKDTL
jgi:hypothetical protein